MYAERQEDKYSTAERGRTERKSLSHESEMSKQRNEPYPSNRKDHDPIPEMWGGSVFCVCLQSYVCYKLKFGVGT